MPHHLPLIIAAATGWAACLTGIAWIASVWLGRALSIGETVLIGAALGVVVAVVVQARLQRKRRKIDDMRDSALW
jgi:membrane protein DedA with SNARE-associated domain